MNTYTFNLIIEADTLEQAQRVLSERIFYDEDYGFEYSIDAGYTPIVSQPDSLEDPLDVWLAFADPDHDEAEYEANTWYIDREFVVKWYHNAVGVVSSKSFSTYEEAVAFLTAEGFENYSNGTEPEVPR